MAGTTLYCFHHAGGTEWQFRSWQSRLQASVRVIGVPVECRTGEVQTIEDMAARALEFLKSAHLPTAAFYGHSMGGHVAYEVCRLLLERGLDLPSAVILGGSPAPGSLPDSGEALRILHETEPMPAFLPGYIAERTAAGVRRACAYSPPRDKIPLQLDLIRGTKDTLVNIRRMQQWEEYCGPTPRYHQVVGGHLFHRTALDDFMTVLEHLVPLNAHSAGTAAAS
ncbi:thioesterase II family protein [Paenarthrobacter sp. NPDC089714]|uniref:thioesterase II family protein n=1 Tax=Paenarthrobacter sp. NPDC089714 TaxID=3364377 RepID=UPI0038024420